MGASYSTCAICVESRYTSEFKAVTKNCKHTALTCQTCVNRHIEAELNNKGNLEIICLVESCRQIMDYSDIENVARKEVMARYDRMLVNSALGGDPNFRWCKNSKCGSGQIHSSGHNEPIMRCESCGQKSCYTHDVLWHTDLTCTQYSDIIKKAEEATQDLLNRETKACPKCGVRITKNGGCNHMTCKISTCKHEFCWLCLADYNAIRKNGNKSHRRTCQFYA
ncbi:unnamed protein product [Rhizophagus irregularis]|nr:unnamed protein product [Rhizophagus irregularis]